MEEKMKELKSQCAFIDGKITNKQAGIAEVFRHFEKEYTFYRAMLTKQGNEVFRDYFQREMLEGIRKNTKSDGINTGLSEDVISHYTTSAFVGIVEWWIKNKMPYSPEVMAKHVYILFRRNEQI
jgi:hypothetical protein